MAKVPTLGPTVEFTTATGNRTRCTAKVFSPGQTGGSTRASITTIKNRATEFSIGLMEGNMTDTGCTASKKAWVFTSTQKERSATADGKMESVSNGYKKRNIIWRSSSFRNREECEPVLKIVGNKTKTKLFTR